MGNDATHYTLPRSIKIILICSLLTVIMPTFLSPLDRICVPESHLITKEF